LKRAPPTPAVELASEFFFDDVLEHLVLKTQFREHHPWWSTLDASGKCRDSAPQRSLGGFLDTILFMACNERLEYTVQQFPDNSA
jgi:hypothetical protein